MNGAFSEKLNQKPPAVVFQRRAVFHSLRRVISRALWKSKSQKVRKINELRLVRNPVDNNS